ncbi:hypothetical protein, partial [Marinobacter sp. ES-1]|uniref:hypothetical protein n=1 Tax=Marinobacter sp. ES-1 TaxID=1396858 RepID=UPI001D0CEBEF
RRANKKGQPEGWPEEGPYYLVNLLSGLLLVLDRQVFYRVGDEVQVDALLGNLQWQLHGFPVSAGQFFTGVEAAAGKDTTQAAQEAEQAGGGITRSRHVDGDLRNVQVALFNLHPAVIKERNWPVKFKGERIAKQVMRKQTLDWQMKVWRIQH